MGARLRRLLWLSRDGPPFPIKILRSAHGRSREKDGSARRLPQDDSGGRIRTTGCCAPGANPRRTQRGWPFALPPLQRSQHGQNLGDLDILVIALHRHPQPARTARNGRRANGGHQPMRITQSPRGRHCRDKEETFFGGHSIGRLVRPLSSLPHQPRFRNGDLLS